MEKGREMTEGREEIEEERIDGDEEKSTSLPWGMKRTIRGAVGSSRATNLQKNALFCSVFVRFIQPEPTLPDEIKQF